MRSLSADATDNPLDVLHRNLQRGEPDDVPTAQPRVEVFLAIGDEPHSSIVSASAAAEHAALDFDEQAAGKVCKVCAPSALRVKLELALDWRSARRVPVERELCFEA